MSAQVSEVAGFVCTESRCESGFDPTPAHDCRSEGFHQDRRWQFDSDYLRVQVASVAYINSRGGEPLPTEPDEWHVQVWVTDVDSQVDSVRQTMSLADYDRLIATLQAARVDLARVVTS